MKKTTDNTMRFKVDGEEAGQTRQILEQVYRALKEKGYNPITQIVGYLLSGDPAYITREGNARNLIRRMERDEFLEELVSYYLEGRE